MLAHAAGLYSPDGQVLAFACSAPSAYRQADERLIHGERLARQAREHVIRVCKKSGDFCRSTDRLLATTLLPFDSEKRKHF